MPIHLGAGMVDDDFWEEEERFMANMRSPAPNLGTRIEPTPTQIPAAVANRNAEAQRDLNTATNRWATAAFSGENGALGVRDQFIRQVRATREEMGRPFAEMQGAWMRSAQGLTSFLRLANKELRDNLVPVISEPFPDGSDVQIMAEVFRNAMKALGSDLPSVELPRANGTQQKRKAGETNEAEDVSVESHAQLRSDIEAVREGDAISRKRVDDANSEVLMINQQLRVLPETAAYAIRRNQLLMRSANLKAEMVEHVKTTREYEVAAKNVFDAVAMRWFSDMAVRTAFMDGEKTLCTRRTLVCTDSSHDRSAEVGEVISWEHVPGSVKQLLHRHGMEWCNTIVVDVFDRREDSIAKRINEKGVLKSSHVEVLSMAMRPCDRKAGEKAPLAEMRFRNVHAPEAEGGYSYHALHHGKKIEYDAAAHKDHDRAHYINQTKRPFMLIWASVLKEPEFR